MPCCEWKIGGNLTPEAKEAKEANALDPMFALSKYLAEPYSGLARPSQIHGGGVAVVTRSTTGWHVR